MFYVSYIYMTPQDNQFNPLNPPSPGKGRFDRPDERPYEPRQRRSGFSARLRKGAGEFIQKRILKNPNQPKEPEMPSAIPKTEPSLITHRPPAPRRSFAPQYGADRNADAHPPRRRKPRDNARRPAIKFHPSISKEEEALQIKYGRPLFPIEPENENLKIVPLGGLGEVGRNMMVLEYKDDIVIIDMGVRFREEDMPGIDYIIPNIAYLKGKEKYIRGIIITHGHFDHTGAIPYIIDKLGNPPIYTTPLTKMMILKRHEEFPNLPKLEIHTVIKEFTHEVQKFNLGTYFSVEPFHVNHTIPDSVGLAISTPVGTILHTCDFKFDFTPVGDYPTDLNVYSNIGAKGVLALLSDSTGSEQPGHTISESVVLENLNEIFEATKGRLIISTFSSLLTRIQQIILLAEKHNRKVVIEGYSMKSSVEIAKELGYIKMEKGTIIDVKNIDDYPPEKIIILCTGAQGDGGAALMRIANREHRFVQLRKNDTVVFSSSVVPGNERTVQFLKDLIARQGAKIFHYKMMDIHASGHAQIEDLKLMISLIKPKFFIPIHGQFYMLQSHAELAKGMGYTDDKIGLSENGDIIELNKEKLSIAKQVVPVNYVMVDGLGVGDVGEVVLRDRRVLAEDGMFVIITILDAKTGRVRGNPDIISRGFVYLRESKEMLSEVRKRTKYIVEKSASGRDAEMNYEYVKDNVREKIGQFLFQQTQRRPMILPVVIEI